MLKFVFWMTALPIEVKKHLKYFLCCVRQRTVNCKLLLFAAFCSFLLPKNESDLYILVYFQQFQKFSGGLQPLENL